jgi:hypothetical protein
MFIYLLPEFFSVSKKCCSLFVVCFFRLLFERAFSWIRRFQQKKEAYVETRRWIENLLHAPILQFYGSVDTGFENNGFSEVFE